MLLLVAKYAITAFVIVAVSEIAKRADRLGALVSSLPLISIMIMIWLHLEKQGNAKIANHAYYTFWYVLPTLPMFLLLPWMLNHGMGFWISLTASMVLTIVCFAITAFLMKHFGVMLMP
ncbi:MAG: DUF3147 family protein [Verrucomicrobia bacterium]|nr:MAG: DUF3147 family protein [Verrucomicrobiota bacterium]